MNVYFVLFLIIAIAILMGSMTRGFHRGFAREFDNWISMIAAILSLMLIAGIIRDFQNNNFSDLAAGIIMLAVFSVAYKLFHILFSSIGLIARLPLIRIVDKVLGLIMGLISGFTILYVLEYLLRNYILK
ncbi:MAG: CvpA family protein [Lachnospiraceae bacterium]|nr:CvpA family protein [Lachnospiraceae bacterium]